MNIQSKGYVHLCYDSAVLNIHILSLCDFLVDIFLRWVLAILLH